MEINPWINDDRIIAKMGKSRVLVIGATGYIGKYITKASAQLGHPTFILVRPATWDSSKKELLDSFTAAGITILHVLDTWNYPWFFFFQDIYTARLFIFLRNFFVPESFVGLFL